MITAVTKLTKELSVAETSFYDLFQLANYRKKFFLGREEWMGRGDVI